MEGRIVITGASGSMGAVAVRAMAEEGYSVIMACRNSRKAESVRSRILEDLPSADIIILPLDLASLDSVRAFADMLGTEPVAALFNNAGIISRSYSLTSDGLENTFAVNYFGPVLLTRLLLPKMLKDARIVNMVSLTCCFVKIDEDSLRPSPRDFSQLGTYARAKLALLHFSLELARRYPELRVNLADPGIVNSNMISLGRWFDPLADILFRPLCKSPERGVKPALAALASEEGNRYFKGNRCMAIPPGYSDPGLDLRLWNETEKMI
ncbi:MAG: SDR family NAD(P)-dependent oxidoreductase [Bacteroidales bacterium]|nr:SDR family NAD(P)-dependent oxidoreductase [Bacteroidales bacterium]